MALQVAAETDQPLGGLSLGEVILVLSNRQGMNLSDLSRATGVPLSTLSRYRRSDRDIPVRVLRVIAGALGVSASYLLDCATAGYLTPPPTPYALIPPMGDPAGRPLSRRKSPVGAVSPAWLFGKNTVSTGEARR